MGYTDPLQTYLNPATQSSNPRVTAALRQIQDAMEVLRVEAPDLAAPPTNNVGQMLAQMMRGGGGGLLGVDPQLPPAERFRTQLEALVNMGFVDQEANIRGGLEMEIGRILFSPHRHQRQREPGRGPAAGRTVTAARSL